MENHPCFKVFMEIKYHNSRLAVLGGKALKVLEDMRNEGMPMQVLDPLITVAKKAAGIDEEKLKELEVKETRRCKWWNRGFCRDRKGCSFNHPKEDCPDHIRDKCINKGCINRRHRKQCRYVDTEEGCHRGLNCEYLHPAKEVVNEVSEVKEKETHTKVECKMEEKDTQTPKVKKCFCAKDFKSNEVHFFDDGVICILKRAICMDEDWIEYEEKVGSEMSLSELLEDLGKVLEASNRLNKKKDKLDD